MVTIPFEISLAAPLSPLLLVESVLLMNRSYRSIRGDPHDLAVEGYVVLARRTSFLTHWQPGRPLRDDASRNISAANPYVVDLVGEPLSWVRKNTLPVRGIKNKSGKENPCKKTQKPCNTVIHTSWAEFDIAHQEYVLREEKRKAEKRETCSSKGKLRKLAKVCVRYVSRELQMPKLAKLPEITCGGLRSALVSVFGGDLPPLQSLSIKTSSKLEVTWCKPCKKTKQMGLLNDWMERSFAPQTVDRGHLDKFKRMLRMNVPFGWEQNDYPYIPTGNGTLFHTRCEGGSWNREPLVSHCKVVPIISAGKPRVVTMYSSEYTRVLSPLHRSLYGHLSRKGWLLVGSPTNERVQWLKGNGDYVSIDYSSATDNIKAAYVKAAVEVLISQAYALTDVQEECLRALGSLRMCFDPEGDITDEATRGQPMGSVMSFPILCLVNKTVVDLSLLDMLEEGKISFKEWTSHRCLINGDDLLYKEPLCSGGDLYRGIVRHGAHVGLIVNIEKTMVSRYLAEINSTLFDCGELEKKINLAALFMGPETADVIGEARKASRTLSGFLILVKRGRKPLSRQKEKIHARLPSPFWRVLKRDKDVLRALLSVPMFGKDMRQNLFPVAMRPHGYDLTRAEEKSVIDLKVQAFQDAGLKQPKGLRQSIIGYGVQSEKAAHRLNIPTPEDNILECLRRRWEEKKWEELVGPLVPCGAGRIPESSLGQAFVDIIQREWIVFDGERELSVIDKLVNAIRGNVRRKITITEYVDRIWKPEYISCRDL